MNAATPEDEIDAERETGAPTPTVVLMRTRKEPRAAGSRSRADDASLSELWRIHGTVRTRFAFTLTLGGKYRAEGIVQEPCSSPGGTLRWPAAMPRQSGHRCSRWPGISPSTCGGRSCGTMSPRGPADRPGPVEPVDQAVTAMDVRAALAQLRPEDWQVIVEMFYLGRSVTEIAQLLSIPEGTVTSRAYDGLRQLRRLLSAASGEHAAQTPAPIPRALSAETRPSAA